MNTTIAILSRIAGAGLAATLTGFIGGFDPLLLFSVTVGAFLLMIGSEDYGIGRKKAAMVELSTNQSHCRESLLAGLPIPRMAQAGRCA